MGKKDPCERHEKNSDWQKKQKLKPRCRENDINNPPTTCGQTKPRATTQTRKVLGRRSWGFQLTRRLKLSRMTFDLKSYMLRPCMDGQGETLRHLRLRIRRANPETPRGTPERAPGTSDLRPALIYNPRRSLRLPSANTPSRILYWTEDLVSE